MTSDFERRRRGESAWREQHMRLGYEKELEHEDARRKEDRRARADFDHSLKVNGLREIRVGASDDGRNRPYSRRKPRGGWNEIASPEGEYLPPRLLVEGEW